MADSSQSHRNFSSYSHSVHSDVLLDPRAGAPPFEDDPDQQHALLSLLSTKLLVEHGGHGVHGLFLALDEEKQGRLKKGQFQQALANHLSLPLTETHIDWLMEMFDMNHEDGIDYTAFGTMLQAWAGGNAGARSTFLGDPKHSPSEAAAGKASEASNQAVLEQVIKSAHAEAVAAAAAGGVSHVLRKLAAVALEKLGGLRKAFGHFDADGDRRLSRQDLGNTLEHHLGLVLEPAELEGLFQALDYEKQGAVAYHEFVRVLTAYAEDTEGGTKPWSPLPTSRTVKEEEVGVEGNETVGFDATMAATTTTTTVAAKASPLLPEDHDVLRQAQEVLTERGLHAYSLLKQLLPECEGKVDTAGLQAIFHKLGLPLSDAQAARLLVKADVMCTGKIVPWELVRLFSAAPTSTTE
jgi:Ca2+-binding EF-hand superfamily protein